MVEVKHKEPHHKVAVVVGENVLMTTPSFAGAVDLGALAAKKKSAASQGTSLTIDVTTGEFEQMVLGQSQKIPIVLDVWAEWCGPCKQLSPILEELAAEYAGRILIAKVDADGEPQIAQALQVQSIPSVFAVIKGQLIPLFQGAYPKEQIRQIFDKLLELAAEQGLSTDVSEEINPESGSESEPEEVPDDPRFDAAAAAVDAGDWVAAKNAYQGILDSDPSDLDAQGGLIMAGIFERVEGKSSPSGDSWEDLMLRADLAAAAGDWEQSFADIIRAVQDSSGSEREEARIRALEFFTLAGEHPAVAGARIALASALF
jgi:putative thioredoxin